MERAEYHWRNKRNDSWQQLSVIIKKPVAALEREMDVFFLWKGERKIRDEED